VTVVEDLTELEARSDSELDEAQQRLFPWERQGGSVQWSRRSEETQAAWGAVAEVRSALYDWEAAAARQVLETAAVSPA
jgi:hypothetical protein